MIFYFCKYNKVYRSLTSIFMICLDLTLLWVLSMWRVLNFKLVFDFSLVGGN